MNSPLRLDVLTDLDSVDGILGEWRELATTSARAPTDAPDWLYPLATRYLAHYRTRFLTWRDERGDLVGVAPFSLVSDRPRIRPIRQLTLWGAAGPRIRGLADVLAREDNRADVLDGLAAWLSAQKDWDVLRINRPQYGSTTPARMRREAERQSWAYHSVLNARSTTYQLDLPPTLEEWQHHLKGSNRRSLVSRRRRFESVRQGALIAAVEPSELAVVLDQFEPLLTRRWGDREIYFRNEPRFSGLLQQAISQLVERNDAWVSVARDGSDFVAGLISIAQNHRAMSLLMVASPDADYRQFALGDQIHEIGIGEAVRRGCRSYDLLWSGPYKETFWRATPRGLDAALIGRGIVGRMAAKAFAQRESRAVRSRS